MSGDTGSNTRQDTMSEVPDDEQITVALLGSQVKWLHALALREQVDFGNIIADQLEQSAAEPRGVKNTNTIGEIAFDLKDWRFGEQAEDDLIGGQKDPARITVKATDARVTVSAVLPSKALHETYFEMSSGLLSSYTYISRAGRNSGPEDVGFTHDEPVVSLKMGSDHSIIQIANPDGDFDEFNYNFVHDASKLYNPSLSGKTIPISSSQAEQLIAAEAESASRAPGGEGSDPAP